MLSIRYKYSQKYYTLFIKNSKFRKIIAFLIYADNIVVTENDKEQKMVFKQCLTKELEIKEFRQLKYFLEIEVANSRFSIFISQQKYVINILKETNK